MNQLVTELNELLSKYGITIQEAVKIYKNHQKQTRQLRRLIQCYEESGNMWQYFVPKENNPCGCGSNCYHYEYDRIDNRIYGVCNACNKDIYEMKQEYIEEFLQRGKWLEK